MITCKMYEIGSHGLVEIKPEEPLALGLLVRYSDRCNNTVFAVCSATLNEHNHEQPCISNRGWRSGLRRSELDGNRWSTVDGANRQPIILTALELAKWEGDAEINKAFDLAQFKLAAEQKAQAKAAERARIAKEYTAAPYRLELREGSKKSKHALGAANLRRLLAVKFPGVKFGVTSESYSMGSSIRVGWTDGPTTETVEKVSNKFQECDFDGMEDLESFRDSVWPEVFGGAHYVHESRHVSDGRLLELAAEMGIFARIDEHGNLVCKDWETQQMIHRESWKRSY